MAGVDDAAALKQQGGQTQGLYLYCFCFGLRVPMPALHRGYELAEEFAGQTQNST